MDETEWGIQEVKRLKKRQLVHYNLVMLLLFVFLLIMWRHEDQFLSFLVYGD